MLPPCQAAQLSLALDDGAPDPGGLSDRGIRLVVRNSSVTACRIPGLSPVIFQDAGGQVLPIERQVPPGMHPGPVVLPAAVPARGSVEATLGWVSDGLRMGGRCYSPARIEVAIGEHAISQPFHGRLCGSPGLPAKFWQSWFRSRSNRETTR